MQQELISVKYNNKTNKQAIDLFIEKLKEKKQNDQQLKQAFHAVSLYYELGLIDSEKDSSFKDKNQNLKFILAQWLWCDYSDLSYKQKFFS